MQAKAERGRSFRIAPQTLNILGMVALALAVLASGALIARLLPDPSLFDLAAAYLGPASLAFAAHWWMAQKD